MSLFALQIIVLATAGMVIGAVVYWLTNYHAAAKLKRLEHDLFLKESDNQRLLHEIDQRLKDNMQMVISLTNLEYRRAKKGASQGSDALQQLQSRFNAMAIIQRALSHRSSATTILAQPLIAELVTQQTEHAKNRVDTSIDANSEELDIMLAGPIGLLVHELCGQAIRGWADIPHSSIAVEMHAVGSDQILRLLADADEEEASFSLNEESMSDDIIDMMCDQVSAKLDRSIDPSSIAWSLQYSSKPPPIALN